MNRGVALRAARANVRRGVALGREFEPEALLESAGQSLCERGEPRRESQQLAHRHRVAYERGVHRGVHRRIACILQQIDEPQMRRAHEQRAMLQEGVARAPLRAAQQLAAGHEQFGASRRREARRTQQAPAWIQRRPRQRFRSRA